MNNLPIHICSLLVLALMFSPSCSKVEDVSLPRGNKGTNVDFDISVTREGKAVAPESQGMTTKSNEERSFGLIGIDYDHRALVVDNTKVDPVRAGYSTFLDSMFWEDIRTESISFSAYYPYVKNIQYEDNLTSYCIPYTVEETIAGPLVSKTVQMAVDQLNMIPLEFQHITNDIGYKICDVTPNEILQGLIHLRKLTAYNVASAGVFVNDVTLSQGIWHRQAYYRKVVVFEGDARVGVGSENEKFVGYDTLSDRMVNSHRYYSIPDEITYGKQYVEVVYDVDGFYNGSYYYEPLKGQVAKYMLYGLLPDNVFVYGRQYTFHIGIDLSSIYTAITFAPSVGDWETKIYENNDEF